MSIFGKDSGSNLFRVNATPASDLQINPAIYNERLSVKAAVAEADSYQNLGSVLDVLEEEFEAAGERGVRNRLARKNQERRLSAFSNFVNNVDFNAEPEVAREAVLAAREVAEERPENRAPTSIETEYVDTVLAFQEEDAPEARADVSISFDDLRLTDIDFETAQRRRASRLEQIQQYIDRNAERREGRPWGMWFAERLLYQSVPGFVSSGQTGIVNPGEATPLENVFAGGRVREEGQLLSLAMATLSEEEWPVFFDGMISRIESATDRGPFEDLTAREDILQDLIAPLPAAVLNSFNAVDNVLPVAGAIVSGGTRIARTPLASLRAVNRTQAAEVAVDQLNRNVAGGRMAMPEGDVAAEILPRLINPEAGATPSSAGHINREMEVVNQIVETTPTTRLNEEELGRAIETAQRRAEQRYGESRLADFGVEEVQLTTGQTVRNMVGTLLKRDGSEFRSDGAARESARWLGLEPDIIETNPGRYGIRITQPVTETGFFQTNLGQTATHRLTSVAASARLNAGQEISAASVVGEGSYNRYIRNLVTPTMKTVQKLSGRERDALANITALGNNRSEWYNRADFDAHYLRLTGSDSSDRSWNAYRALINMNDVEWQLRNDAMFAEKQTQGLRTVSFETPFVEVTPTNGRVIDEAPEGQRMYNTETGEMVDELPDGFVLVELEDDIFGANGWPARYSAVRRNAVRESELNRNQVGYRPGGHRMYQADYFVKQARRRALPDGADYLERPATFIGGRTKREVREWADIMEQARKFYNDAIEEGLDPRLIAQRLDDEVLFDRAGFPRGSQFIEDIQMGRISAKEAFEIVLDRQLPSAYGRTPGGRFANETGFESMMASQGRMYYSRRGDEALKDYQGNAAPTVDFGEMINQSLQNVARLASFSDFKTEMMTRWVNTYGDVTEAATRNPADLFFNGSVNRKGTDPRIAESAESQRRAILNAMHFREDGLIDFDVMQRQLTDWVAEQDWLKSVPGIKDPVNFAAEMKNWFKTQNPQAALMGMAFDIKLGMFNIAQIPLQASHYAAIWQLSKAGTRYNAGSFINSPMAWSYSMRREGAEQMLDHLVNTGMHKTLGLDEGEYRAMMRSLKNSGFNDVGGSHTMIAELGARQTVNGAGGAMRSLREAGRTPFTLTEGSMRSSSWMIAWREVRDEFPKLKMDSPDFLRRVTGRADDYSFNMTRATSATWQRGAMAIPTQFWGYFARMLEAMTSNKFSRAQRARLVLGQSVLFGATAGIPLANLVPMAAEGMGRDPTGETAQLNTFQGLVERGLIDHTYLWMTGKDALISERVGAGSFAGAFLQTLIGESPYGAVSPGEVLGGASYSIWLDTFGDAAEFAGDALKYAAVAGNGNLSGGPVVRDSFLRMASNISTVNNATRAYMIHRYGVLQSSNQYLTMDDVDPSFSIEAVLSFQPGETRHLTNMFNYLEHREEAVKDIANVIRRYNGLVVNDSQNAADYAEELRAFLMLQDPDYVEEAVRSTQGQFDSLYDSVQRQVDQARVRRSASEQIMEDR